MKTKKTTQDERYTYVPNEYVFVFEGKLVALCGRYKDDETGEKGMVLRKHNLVVIPVFKKGYIWEKIYESKKMW